MRCVKGPNGERKIKEGDTKGPVLFDSSHQRNEKKWIKQVSDVQ